MDGWIRKGKKQGIKGQCRLAMFKQNVSIAPILDARITWRIGFGHQRRERELCTAARRGWLPTVMKSSVDIELRRCTARRRRETTTQGVNCDKHRISVAVS